MNARARRRAWRAAQGALLGTGAPAGWLLIQVVTGTAVRTALEESPWLYAYMLLATSTAFGIFGFVLGVREEQLSRANVRLESESITDTVTAIPNRRYFDHRLGESIAMARRTGATVALALLDIDKFKSINDLYGHSAGDTALQAVAAALSHSLRSGETVARVGGDEFGVILAGQHPEEAGIACERLRLAGCITVILGWAGEVSVALSGGVAAAATLAGIGPDVLYRTADEALYEAKAAGRNRTVARLISADSIESELGVVAVTGVPEVKRPEGI